MVYEEHSLWGTLSQDTFSPLTFQPCVRAGGFVNGAACLLAWKLASFFMCDPWQCWPHPLLPTPPCVHCSNLTAQVQKHFPLKGHSPWRSAMDMCDVEQWFSTGGSANPLLGRGPVLSGLCLGGKKIFYCAFNFEEYFYAAECCLFTLFNSTWQ